MIGKKLPSLQASCRTKTSIFNRFITEFKKLNAIKAQQGLFRHNESVIDPIPFDSCETMNFPYDTDPFRYTPITGEAK